MMCHTFARTVNDTMKLFKRPPLVRAANYMFALNSSILIYFTTKVNSLLVFEDKKGKIIVIVTRDGNLQTKIDGFLISDSLRI